MKKFENITEHVMNNPMNIKASLRYAALEYLIETDSNYEKYRDNESVDVKELQKTDEKYCKLVISYIREYYRNTKKNGTVFFTVITRDNSYINQKVIR